MEKHTLTVDGENSGKRLDVFLSAQIPGLSRTQAQKIIADGAAFVNAKPGKANLKLGVNDVITCSVPDPVELAVIPESIPLEIIYEDSDLLVVNKPRGMVVHPAHGNYSRTLVNALLAHCRDLSGINGVLRPGIVHRIDKDTSGLLAVAKNDLAHRELARQIKEHTVKRVYVALVHGVVMEPGGLIDAPIGRDERDRQKMAVNLKNSKEAITEYRVLERLQAYTLVECRLKTGRTHQIRVHLAYIKHPVAGDPKYGPKKTLFGLKGQALHAGTLGFRHPRTGDWLEFTAAPPSEFIKAIAALGSRYKFEEGDELCGEI